MCTALLCYDLILNIKFRPTSDQEEARTPLCRPEGLVVDEESSGEAIRPDNLATINRTDASRGRCIANLFVNTIKVFAEVLLWDVEVCRRTEDGAGQKVVQRSNS